MNRSPDVEVIFEFNGTRKNPANDGYRPAHLVMDDYLTTGIHHYYGVESLQMEQQRVQSHFCLPNRIRIVYGLEKRLAYKKVPVLSDMLLSLVFITQYCA